MADVGDHAFADSHAQGRRFDAPRALLLAWTIVAVTSSCALAVALPAPAPGMLTVRLLHHAYDAGHLLALGVATGGISWTWCRWGAPRGWRSGPAIWLACYAMATLVLRDDLTNVVRRQRLLLPAIGAAVGLAIPAAWKVGRLLARSGIPWLPIILGIALTFSNHVLLTLNYPGVHLVVAVGAAILVAGGLFRHSTRVNAPFCRWYSPTEIIVPVVLGTASIVVKPSASVWRELFSSSGTVLAPYLARLLPERRGEQRPLVVEGSPWFVSRATAPPVQPSKSNLVSRDAVVVFVTIDALRADLAPKHAKTLVALDRVRNTAVEFLNARAPSPSTTTTLISVFTGKYYSALYWTPLEAPPEFKGVPMPRTDPTPRLPALLGRSGIPSVHVSTLRGNDSAVGGPGVGFTTERLTQADYGPADEAITLLIEELRQHVSGPLFAYTHLVDAHAPYNLAGTDGTEYERYVREVQLVDRALARLVDFIDGHDIGKRTVLIVSADHGEAFGEHNTMYHALTVYEELLRIPLYIRVPGVVHRVVERPVTLMDVAPTVLDLYGLPVPGYYMAQSLVPFLRGGDPRPDRPIAVDAGRRMEALYFPDGKKAIINIPFRTEELYDLETDPGELKNLIDDKSAHASRYLGALYRFFEAHRFRREGYETPWRQY